MRVVAGTARGRPLRAPAGPVTRPTSDRVRESVFNILTSMDAVEGAAVVDLFAGSGALGVEALSRGAATATFVDADRSAVDAIRRNLGLLDDSVEAHVVRSDALAWSRSGGAALDVAFVDPPYAWDRWDELLAALAPRARLVVAETGRDLDPGPVWETVRSRRYGSTVVTFLRPIPAPGAGGDPTMHAAHAQPRGGM